MQAEASLFHACSVFGADRKQALVSLFSAALFLQEQQLQDRLFKVRNSALNKVRQFGAMKLLEFFWVAGVLQNDAHFRTALKHACAVSLVRTFKTDCYWFPRWSR